MSSPGSAGMKTQPIYGSRKASLTLDIIVVGCGISGLCAAFCLTQAGHRVTVVESSLVLGEVGAGIVVGPNSSRLLQRWGLAKRLDEVSVRAEGATIRRYSTGERIGTNNWGTAESNYGAPYHLVHRADLHQLLYDLVAPHVTILLGSPVIGCNPDPVAPSVTLESGKVLKADLIVGADGLKSYVQQVVLGRSNRADSTGDAAYRALIPTSLMKQDSELRELIEPPQLTSWLAPGRHLRRNELYNLVLLHQDDESVESWTAKGNVDEMRRDFDDFEPRAQKILSFVQSVMKFRLMDRKPLEKWIHDSGRVILLGDACHPMLPYKAQGAAMAIEDAAVLGNLLSRISDISQLGPLLEAYQDLRLPRTAMVQESSRANQRVFHLPDGPEQRERDEKLKPSTLEASDNKAESQNHKGGNQGKGQDKAAEGALLGYDADAEVDKWWTSHGSELEALVRSKPPRLNGRDTTFVGAVCICACLLIFLSRR